MQQLLQMMQKISAEPNNNAKVQSVAPASQIVPTDEESIDGSAELSAEASTDSEISSTDSSEPISERPLSSSLEQQNAAIDTMTPTQNAELVVTTTDNDIVHVEPEEFSEDDIVVDEPIVPTAPKKTGFIKRWVKKAVSWVKRLVGF